MNSQTSTSNQGEMRGFVYANADVQKTFKILVDNIVYNSHCCLLVGPPGVGKTHLLHRVIDILGASIQPLYFEKSYTDFENLIKDMTQALSLDLEPGQELKELENYFESLKRGRPIALFFDNVESYGEETFSQLLSFIGIISHKNKTASVILSSQPAFLGNLRAGCFQNNDDIVTNRCELHPIPAHEIENYVHRRLKHLGLEGKVLFSDAAVTKIVDYSKGIPESINRIFDNAILINSDSSIRITGELIDQVASRQVSSLVVEGHDVPSASGVKIKQQDEAVLPTKAGITKNVQDLQTEEKKIASNRPVKTTIERLLGVLNLSNKEPLDSLPGENEALKVKVNKNTWDGLNVLQLIPFMLLIIAIALLSYSVQIKREYQSKSSGQSINGYVTKSELSAGKQDAETSDLLGFRTPDIDPAVKESMVLDGQENRNSQTLSELHFKNGDGVLGETLLSERQKSVEKKSGFTTKSEQLGIKEIEKREGNVDYGLSILISASKKGYAKAVDQLLEYGYEVNARNEDGDTALIGAVSNNHLEVVQVLLERGADFSIANNLGVTPMPSAIHNQNIPIIETLLNAGANPHNVDERNRTILMVAAENDGSLELVERLLKFGVNINATRLDGRTALMNAAEKGNEDIVKILLNRGVDVTMIDKNGDSAAEIAKKAGFVYLAKLISTQGTKGSNN